MYINYTNSNKMAGAGDDVFTFDENSINMRGMESYNFNESLRGRENEALMRRIEMAEDRQRRALAALAAAQREADAAARILMMLRAQGASAATGMRYGLSTNLNQPMFS